MRDQEVFISWRHKWMALVLALATNSAAFVICWTILGVKPVPFAPTMGIVAAVDFVPALIIGRRLLSRPRLDIFRFWFAGAIAGFIPAFVVLAGPAGTVFVLLASPCILAGSFAG